MSDNLNVPVWSREPIEQLLAPLEDGRILHHGWSPQCETEPAPNNADWGVLKTTAIQPAEFQPEHNKRLPDSLAPRASLEVKAGDLLLTCAGPRSRCGIACLVRNTRPRLILSGKMYRFRPRKEKMTPQFLEAFLQSEEARVAIDRMKTGISDSGLNLTHDRFRQLPVPVPPLPEQYRIVEEIEKQFTRLDAGIAALRRTQANLKRYRAAVLKAACEGRLVPSEAELAKQKSSKRGSIPQKSVTIDFESGAILLERILTERRQTWRGRGKYQEPTAPDADSLPKLPERWTWASLDQLLSLMRNGISAKPDAESGLPILRISAVRALSVNLAESRFLNAKASDYPDYALTEGDLLFTRYNGNPELVGVCGVVPALTSPFVHPDKLIRCKLVHSGVLSDFVAMMANVGASRAYLAKRVRTTAGQAGISGGDLKGLPIPLAPIAEQTRIVAEVERRLSVVQELEAVVNINRHRATRLRQSILKTAFAG